MEVFKIVGRDYHSWIFRKGEPLSLEYKMNQITKPEIKGSKLFAFKSFSIAKSNIHPGQHILLCEAEGVISCEGYRVPFLGCYNNDLEVAKKFWTRYHRGDPNRLRHVQYLGYGSLMCDSLKPMILCNTQTDRATRAYLVHALNQKAP